MATQFLLVTCLLLCIVSEILSSNPDSEIAQDSSSKAQTVPKKQLKRQVDVSQTTDASTLRQSSFSYSKVIGSIRSGTYITREVLHKVLPNGYVTVERKDRVTIGRPDLFAPSEDEYALNTPSNTKPVDSYVPEVPTKQVSIPEKANFNNYEGSNFNSANPNLRQGPTNQASIPENTNFNNYRSSNTEPVNPNVPEEPIKQATIPENTNFNSQRGSNVKYLNTNVPEEPANSAASIPENTNFNSYTRRTGLSGFPINFMQNNNDNKNINNRPIYIARRPVSNYGQRIPNPESPVKFPEPVLDFNPAVTNYNLNVKRGGAFGNLNNGKDSENVEQNRQDLPNNNDTNIDSSFLFRSSSVDLNINEQSRNIRPAIFPPRIYKNFNPQLGRNSTNSFNGYRRNRYPQNTLGGGSRGQTRNPPVGPSRPNPSGGNAPPADSFGTNPKQNENKGIASDANLFAGIVNDFTFKLIQDINVESNFVVSPLSIFIALSMCYLGSDGRTKAQLENFLGLNLNSVHGEKLHQGIKDLITFVLPESNEYQLFIANGMFLGNNFTVNPEFISYIQWFYGAELKNLDFRNPQLSVPAINDWISSATRNTITQLSDQPPPLLTSLLLLNAIYFKGIWKTQFQADMTYSSRFFTHDGKTKMVPTMPLYRATFPFYRSTRERHTFIKIPYQGDKVSMILALPFDFRERPMMSVTDRRLCNVRDAMEDTILDSLLLPKFKLEHTASLKNPLNRLGIRDLFNPTAVDLSKLRTANDVVVSDIVHKAVVDVNEQGTTAAAVTNVRFVPLSYRNTTDFVVNHPFAFYIIHEPSGLVLFYGKVYDIGEETSTNSNPGPMRG